MSAGPFFSQQSSFLAHHLVVRATAFLQHPLCPRAQLAMPPPSPQPRCHLYPLLPVLPRRGAGQLLWICSGPGLAGSASAHVLAQRGTGEQMNLGSSWLPGRGAVGSPHLPRCVSGLMLGCSSHPRWLRGGVHWASLPPAPHLINKVGGPPLSQSMPRLRCAQTPRRWSPSPPVPLSPHQLPWVHHGGVCASPRAGVHRRPRGMRQRWAAAAAPEQIL